MEAEVPGHHAGRPTLALSGRVERSGTRVGCGAGLPVPSALKVVLTSATLRPFVCPISVARPHRWLCS